MKLNEASYILSYFLGSFHFVNNKVFRMIQTIQTVIQTIIQTVKDHRKCCIWTISSSVIPMKYRSQK